MKFKFKSLTQVLLSLFLARLLITGASIGDALTILSLAGLNGYWLFLEANKEPEVNRDLKDRIIALEEKTQKVENKVGAMTIASHLRR